jgi:organic hydroperoxide reductase OsmC/OhrA
MSSAVVVLQTKQPIQKHEKLICAPHHCLFPEGDGFNLQARLNLSLPGLAREVAQALVDAAHQTCPYSKATRGYIQVEINLV